MIHIVLNPERPLDLSGVAMVMVCREGRTPQGKGSSVLEKVPPNRDVGSWSREGRCGASATSGITSRSRTAQQAETSQSGLERRPPANAREPAEATKEP